MECPICKEEVWVLNNTNKGEACYNCRKKYNLTITDYTEYKEPENEIL